MSEAVTPMIEPNPDQMRNHIEALFGGMQAAGIQDGRIELRTICKREGGAPRLDHRYFGVDETDEAVDWGAGKNREPNTHVYIGAALRDPNIFPADFASDSDFHGATAYHLDCDEAGAWEKARKEWTDRKIPPSFVTYTSRKPHTRAQAWWLLEEPQKDATAYHDQLKALAVAFHGDQTVCNPSRIMRLAGTINWPTKPGRQLELTEFKQAANHRVYSQDQIARAVPPIQASFADVRQAAPEAPKVERVDFDPDKLRPGDLLALIRAGKDWHNNMIKLVAHWCHRGWSDAEIEAVAESITLPGYTIQQTLKEMRKAVSGARIKYHRPNTEETVEDVEKQAQETEDALAPRPIGLLDGTKIPPRRWLLGKHFIRGFVTLTIAPGGVGKSTLAIAEAIAVASGRPITGSPCHEGRSAGTAWIYNNEDPRDELERRVSAIAKQHGIAMSELSDRLFVNSGMDRRLLIARQGERGAVVYTPDVAAMKAHIIKRKIAFMTIDPLVRAHQLEENDNGAIDGVMAVFSAIAAETGCVFHLVHHTRKPPGGSSEGHAGNMDSGRGAGSVAAAARIVRTLSEMSSKDAERFNVKEEDRRRYARLDDAKANLSAPGHETQWFEKVTVYLENGQGFFPEGDAMGVLVPVELEEAKTVEGGAEDRMAVASAVAQVMGEEVEMTLNKVRSAVVAKGYLGVGKTRAGEMIKDAIPAGPDSIAVGQYRYSWSKQGMHASAEIVITKWSM